MDGHVAAGGSCRGRGAVERVASSTFEAAGAKVSLLEPVEGLPDLVFTANAAMIYRQAGAAFRGSGIGSGKAKSRTIGAGLPEHGFEVVDVPENFSFEGAGDALFCGDTLYAGYRMRSDAAGHQEIGRMLGVPRDSGRAGRRPLLSSRHVLLPARATAKRSGIRRRSTSTASGRSAST